MERLARPGTQSHLSIAALNIDAVERVGPLQILGDGIELLQKQGPTGIHLQSQGSAPRDTAASRCSPEKLPEMTLRVVFAEDNYLVREGTSALLREAGEIELVSAVEDLQSLLDAVEEHAPDAVLTDIRMPPTHTTEGIDAAKRIRAEHPEIGVLVLSQFADEEYAYDLLKEGAAGLGYLLKERVAEIDELVRALKEVAAGGSVLDPKVVEGLVGRRNERQDSPLEKLTERERDVLQQIAEGKNNAAIADALFLSPRAVEKHINSIFQKLGLSEEPRVHRRVMAVLTFLKGTSTAGL
ncbi:MAG: hypothetical protein QOH48_1811 [Actinomycetota bacterium]|nr:hypothetical protein [Actinomycetota bacterium]